MRPGLHERPRGTKPGLNLLTQRCCVDWCLCVYCHKTTVAKKWTFGTVNYRYDKLEVAKAMKCDECGHDIEKPSAFLGVAKCKLQFRLGNRDVWRLVDTKDHHCYRIPLEDLSGISWIKAHRISSRRRPLSETVREESFLQASLAEESSSIRRVIDHAEKGMREIESELSNIDQTSREVDVELSRVARGDEKALTSMSVRLASCQSRLLLSSVEERLDASQAMLLQADGMATDLGRRIHGTLGRWREIFLARIGVGFLDSENLIAELSQKLDVEDSVPPTLFSQYKANLDQVQADLDAIHDDSRAVSELRYFMRRIISRMKTQRDHIGKQLDYITRLDSVCKRLDGELVETLFDDL